MRATTIHEQVDEVINRILDKLISEYKPEKVILFGSYAYGNPGPDSDIDLLIIKDASEAFLDRCFTVRRVVSDPSRTVALEVLVFTPREVSQSLAGGDQFVEEIVDRGLVIYAA